MILYNKTDGSSILVDRTIHITIVHLREWREGQQIKEARIELDNERLDELIAMLKIEREKEPY